MSDQIPQQRELAERFANADRDRARLIDEAVAARAAERANERAKMMKTMGSAGGS